MPELGFKEFFEFFRWFLEAERFSGLKSPIHRLDPRVKIISSVALILSTLAVEGAAYLLIFAFIVLAVLAASRVPKIPFLSRSMPFTLFSVVVALPVPFITPGVPAALIPFPFATLTPTFEGIYRALTFVFRVWICIAAALLLTFTTRFPDIAAGLRRLGVPPLLSSMLLLTYRYVFLFAEEALTMLQAKELRTMRKERFMERIKGVGRLAGSLLLRAYERGEEVYYAMRLRGFQGGEITQNTSFKLKAGDALFLAGVIAACCSVVFSGWGIPSLIAFWIPPYRVVLVKTLLNWVTLILPLAGGLIIA